MSSINIAEINGAFQAVCEFCRDYRKSSRGLSSRDPAALNVRDNLKKIANWLDETLNSHRGFPIRFQTSEGSGLFPRVPWICLLPPNQRVSEGIYAGICFGMEGSGFVAGCMKSVTNEVVLETVKRRGQTPLLIDAGDFNDAFANPLEVLINAFEPNQLLDHLRTSLDMGFDRLGITIESNASTQPCFWIFQGNPQYFDIDRYLRTRTQLRWKVSQYTERVSEGDKVLLWRSGANGGVIAECIVEAAPTISNAEEASEFYRESKGPDESAPRCQLGIAKLFLDNPIPRDSIKAVLPELRIIRSPQGTNFPITESEYSTILALRGKNEYSNFIRILLRRYYDEQIIFSSSAKKHRYAIASIDAKGVSVERLDANDNQRVTFAQAEKLLKDVKEVGSLEFQYLDSTSAIRNTVLQIESLALSADQKRIVYVPDNLSRLPNFLQVLGHLKTTNPFYKPAMLLCVLDGIDSAELSVNRIPFDWIAPRFVAKMKSLGTEVTEREAAHPFYHLINDLIWLHAVSNRTDLMQDGADGPKVARQKVKYALLKDTYWSLLQDSDSRRAVRHQLETAMIPILPLNEILFAAERAIDATGFVHAPDLVRRFISSIATKPFIILTGNSGTGKTKLAQLVAHWMTGSFNESTNGYSIVPVGADWTDNRNVVGFVNHLRKDSQQNPIYQSTPTLDLLLRAASDLSRPYFLILDEMNLSHVERYFSDFLSCMESKKPISLHQEKQALSTAAGVMVPQEIAIPENFYVIGTVNVDETTYMFSPKILDRSNVLEFRIDPQQANEFLASANNHLHPIEPDLGAAVGFLELSNRARGLIGPALPLLAEPVVVRCQLSLQELFALLHQARLEFAFRTISEVMRYIQVDFALSKNPSDWSWLNTLDVQTLQKLLPKLHGSRRRLEPILAALATYCERQDASAAHKILQRDFDLTGYPPVTLPTDVHFPLSHAKLIGMIEAVRRDQFVSFIQ